MRNNGNLPGSSEEEDPSDPESDSDEEEDEVESSDEEGGDSNQNDANEAQNQCVEYHNPHVPISKSFKSFV